MPTQEEQDAIVVAYGQAFSSPEGKVVLEDLRKCYQKRSSMDPNPHMLAFREGQRSVVLAIEALMETAGYIMDARVSGKQTIVILAGDETDPREYHGWRLEEETTSDDSTT